LAPSYAVYSKFFLYSSSVSIVSSSPSLFSNLSIHENCFTWRLLSVGLSLWCSFLFSYLLFNDCLKMMSNCHKLCFDFYQNFLKTQNAGAFTTYLWFHFRHPLTLSIFSLARSNENLPDTWLSTLKLFPTSSKSLRFPDKLMDRCSRHDLPPFGTHGTFCIPDLIVYLPSGFWNTFYLLPLCFSMYTVIIISCISFLLLSYQLVFLCILFMAPRMCVHQQTLESEYSPLSSFILFLYLSIYKSPISCIVICAFIFVNG